MARSSSYTGCGERVSASAAPGAAILTASCHGDGFARIRRESSCSVLGFSVAAPQPPSSPQRHPPVNTASHRCHTGVTWHAALTSLAHVQ